MATALQKKNETNRAVVLDAYRAIYVPIPKVANSSLKAICAELLRENIDPAHYADRPKGPFGDTASRRYLRQQRILITSGDLDRYDGHWKFAFVRNPWDRLVSCFADKIERNGCVASGIGRLAAFYTGMSFEDFVSAVCSVPDKKADRHFKSQHRFVTDRRQRLRVDYLGRFENLNEDCGFVFDKIGAKNIRMPHLAQSSRRHYRDYYTPALVDMVANRYSTDIDLFSYQF